MPNLISIFLTSTLRSRNPKTLLPPFSLSKLLHNAPETLTPPQPPNPNPNPRNRTRTPLEKQFESSIAKLKPGFTPNDVVSAIHDLPDPDLALDLFRWASLQRGFKHDDISYLSVIKILTNCNRHRLVEPLLDEVLSGACQPNVALYNALIRFCVGRKLLFNRAFDVYNKMLRSEHCKPDLETYAMLFGSVLRKFGKLNVCYVYLHAVRSLTKQMKVCGVIPDLYVLNLIVKAYAMCLEVDEAVRVFREMGLYGCAPNRYSYSYVVKACCEKGRLFQGLEFFREMKDKGLVPKGSTYVVLVCSLALERMFENAIEVSFEMLGNSMSPDLLTYKTLLEELCRAGKVVQASELLEEFRKKDSRMTDSNYRVLFDGLST